MILSLRKGLTALTAGGLLALSSQAAAEETGSLATTSEIAALAAAYEQGALGAGKCDWVHPATESPTTIPCELVPQQLLTVMARNNANKQAQLELGKRYEEGRGVAQDLRMARKYYRMAARDMVRRGPIIMARRNADTIAFFEFNHDSYGIESGTNGPAFPRYREAPGLSEARERLKRLPD